MIYTVNSEKFIKSVTYGDTHVNDCILSSYVIIVSNNIHAYGRERDNKICNYTRNLYPERDVYMCDNKEDMYREYYKQLEENTYLILSIIYQSLKGDDIIIIASKKELRIFNYIKAISDFIYENFGYYTYNTFELCDSLNDDDHIHRIKKCVKKELERVQNKAYSNVLLSYTDNESELKPLLKEISELSKSRIIKIMLLCGVNEIEIDEDDSKKELISVLKSRLESLSELPFDE